MNFYKTGGLPGLYDYAIPPGYGDTFFMYAFDGDVFTAGQSYFSQRIQFRDGAFIVRSWNGQDTVNQGNIQLYDRYKYYWFAPPGVNLSSFRSGMMVLPERYYPENSFLQFDIINAQPIIAGVDGALTVYASQLIFSGVRRRPGVVSDPDPSPYPYREIPFMYPVSVIINNYASTGGVLNPYVQYLIPINDYDFELRRIEAPFLSQSAGGAITADQFKMTLYDNEAYQLSNVPILGSRMLNFNDGSILGSNGLSGEYNFVPCPPLLYKIGSNIRFDIWSLLFNPTVLPQTFVLNFYGVRRIPC